MKKAFTLIELIVVLAIIAILALILVPQVTGYIEDTQKSAALSDCRTIEVSAQAYLVERIIDTDKGDLTVDTLNARTGVEDGKISNLTVTDNELIKFNYAYDGDTVVYYSNSLCGFASASRAYYDEITDIQNGSDNPAMYGYRFQSEYERKNYEFEDEEYVIISDLKDNKTKVNDKKTKSVFMFASLNPGENRFENSTVDYIYNKETDSWYKLHVREGYNPNNVDLGELYRANGYTRYNEEVLSNALFESESDVPEDLNKNFYWVYDENFNPQ